MTLLCVTCTKQSHPEMYLCQYKWGAWEGGPALAWETWPQGQGVGRRDSHPS